VLIEYPTVSEARAAIEGANGTSLLEQVISVDFAFVRPPPGKGQKAGDNIGKREQRERGRSRSPGARESSEGRD